MRLLIVGQGAQYSGYARVLRTLAPMFAEEFDVSYFALNCRPAPDLIGVDCFGPTRRNDPYGFKELPQVLARVRPNVVFACHDSMILAAQTGIVRTHLPGAGVVLYVPMEWALPDPATVQLLAAADRLVCYTDTARHWLAAPVGPHLPVSAEPMPHGVDRQTFGPIASTGIRDQSTDRTTARAAARRLLGLPADDVIILNANRDTPRKRLEVTVEAFAEAAERLPTARLILTHGQRLRGQARQPAIADRLLIPDEPPATDSALNLYYISADLGVTTCTAEGWGLIAFEHAAVGAAQLMPAHPALREIWGPAATYVDYAETSVPGYGLVDPTDVAAAMVTLCRDPARVLELGRRAQRRMSPSCFDWPVIARHWIDLLHQAT